MSSNSDTEIAAFKSAFQFFIRTAQGSVNKINTNPRNLANFCQILSNAREKDSKIHIIGSGRSGQIAKILGECFKDIGFNVSFFGENLASPIKKGDVGLVVTGSGWTKYTTSAIDNCIRNNAKILIFTGNMDSKAARMSDTVIQIPIGFQFQDYQFFHSEDVVPISPLGTIFELTTLVIGIGLINGIFSGSCTNGFNDGTSAILTSANLAYEKLILDQNLPEFISLIKEYHDNIHSKIFFIGRGLNKSVRNFTSSRFKQLNINVCSMDDWRFRKENDLLIAISGSGKSSSVIDAVNIGKESFMKIASITSSSDSKLSSISDIILNVSGRSESISPDHHSLVKPAIYLPVFEYTAALLFDACVVQIALDFGLTGEEY